MPLTARINILELSFYESIKRVTRSRALMRISRTTRPADAIVRRFLFCRAFRKMKSLSLYVYTILLSASHHRKTRAETRQLSLYTSTISCFKKHRESTLYVPMYCVSKNEPFPVTSRQSLDYYIKSRTNNVYRHNNPPEAPLNDDNNEITRVVGGGEYAVDSSIYALGLT